MIVMAYIAWPFNNAPCPRRTCPPLPSGWTRCAAACPCRRRRADYPLAPCAAESSSPVGPTVDNVAPRPGAQSPTLCTLTFVTCVVSVFMFVHRSSFYSPAPVDFCNFPPLPSPLPSQGPPSPSVLHTTTHSHFSPDTDSFRSNTGRRAFGGAGSSRMAPYPVAHRSSSKPTKLRPKVPALWTPGTI